EGQRPPNFPVRGLLPFLRHALATDPDGFHVAVVKGRIVCYAITILRGKTHFLAQFFALPGMQSRGVGRQVLTRAFDAPRPPRGPQDCGYVVIQGNGAIGPGGVLDPSLSAALMSAAIAKAHEIGMKAVSAWVPGLNKGALTAAFEAGLKIEFLTAWMAARDIIR